MGKRRVKKTSAKNTKPWFTPEVKAIAAKKQAYLLFWHDFLSYDEYINVRNKK